MIPGFRVLGIEGTRVPRKKYLEIMFAEVVTWRRIREGMVYARPRRNSGILSLEEKTKKIKNLSCCSGCMKKWYQSMVTTLGLLGLMNELRRNSI
jgi:hypothetical protein